MAAINTENYRLTADKFSDGTVKITVLSGGTWSPLGVLNLPADPDVLPTVIELLKAYLPAKPKATAQASHTATQKGAKKDGKR